MVRQWSIDYNTRLLPENFGKADNKRNFLAYHKENMFVGLQ